jgi:hypothetical protein
MTLAATGGNIGFMEWLRRDPDSELTQIAEQCLRDAGIQIFPAPADSPHKFEEAFQDRRILVRLFATMRSNVELIDLIDAWVAFGQVAHFQFSPVQKEQAR